MSDAKRPDEAAEGIATHFSRRALRRVKVTDPRKRHGREPRITPCRAERLEQRLLLSTVSFQPQQTFATGSNPFCVAVADLNGDGHPDLVVANYHEGNVGVLLGHGNGTFAAERTFYSGATPTSVVVCDVNGDGKLDLVVYTKGPQSVNVLLGNGNGTFAAVLQDVVPDVQTNLFALAAVADVNGDGKPDLLTFGNYNGFPGLAVSFGNGDGTFAPPILLDNGASFPVALAVADVNGDGKPDLVCGNSGYPSGSGISVVLGNGDGTFAAPQTVDAPPPSPPYAVVVADVNGDGKRDIIVSTGPSVGVLLGIGNGTFGAEQTFSAGAYPSSVAVADVNGDDNPDLVVANEKSGTVSVLLGNGNGTFASPQSLSTGASPSSVAVADVNGDGKPELVVANEKSGTVSVLLATEASTTSLAASTGSVAQGGSVTFTATVSPAAGGGATATGVVDFIQSGNSIGTAAVQSNGKAVFSTASLPVGTDTVTASYSGDGAYFASASLGATVHVLVPSAASNTTIQASAPSAQGGSSVTLTATVTPAASGVPPTGVVSFIENGNAIGTANVQSNGTAVFITASLPTGTNSITANYGGDSNYKPSTSSPATVQVTGGLAASTTALVASAPSANGGVPLTFTATVSPTAGGGQTPTGSVTFFDGTTALSAAMPLNSSGIAALSTLALAAGSHSITASYSGDSVYSASSAPAVTEMIGNSVLASIIAPDVTTSQTTGEVVTIEFKDASSPIDMTTLIGADLNIAGPMGSSPGISKVNVAVNDTIGEDVTASYTLSPPGTSWSASPLGTYVVTLLAGSVKDIAGSVVASSTASFSVNSVEDTSFGTSGNVSVNFTCEAIVPLNGESLLVGQQGSDTDGTLQGVLELLDANGSPDPNFGTKGIVTTSMGANDVFNNAAIDANGNIVAVGATGVGTTNESFLVARYSSSPSGTSPGGTPDAAFGSGGFATAFAAPGQGPAMASSVALEPDGTIVAAGEANGQFALARFVAIKLPGGPNPGSLDPNFAGGQVTPGMTVPGVVVQVVANSDGDIIGLGLSSDGSSLVPFAVNYDGSTDTSFNPGLVPISQLAATYPTGPGSVAANVEGLAFTPGGNLLVCGQGAANLGGGMGVVRLTTSGQVDTLFGVNGLAHSAFGDGTTDDADTIAVNPDTGEFLLVGTTGASGQIQTAVAAFNPDGTLQTTFGSGGQQTLPNPAGAAAGNTDSASPLSVHGVHGIHGAVASFDAKTNGVVVGGGGSGISAFRKVKPFGISVASVSDLPETVKHHVIRTYSVTLLNNTKNTKVTVTVTGGMAHIYQLEDQLELDLTSTGPALVVNIKTKGSGPVFLSKVTVSGSLRSFTAPTAALIGNFTVSDAGNVMASVTLGDISGVLHSDGGIAHLTAGNVSGSVSCQEDLGTLKVKSVTGTIAAGQNITSFSAASLSNATILAGVGLGTDGKLGGTGTALDNPGSGLIFSLNVSGSIATSFIGAGVNPGADFIFGDSDDYSSSSGSAIRSITIRHGIGSGTRIESSSFPRFVHIPIKTLTATQTAFVSLKTTPTG